MDTPLTISVVFVALFYVALFVATNARGERSREEGIMESVNQKARARRVREIQRSRLGGVDRIVLDREAEAPWERYAHIYQNGCGTNLHDMPTTESHEAYSEGSWRFVGTIDLDTGDLVKRS